MSKICCNCEKLIINDITYFIEEKIHTSNVSKIYVAHKNCNDVHIEKYILKIYMEHQSQQAINEVNALKILKSERIVELIDYKLEKGVIIMPRFSHDLFDLIIECQNKRKKLSLYSIQKYFTELIEGLHYMHSQCVVHLDIKPENILLTNDHHIVYIDFGFSICLTVGMNDENNNIYLSKGTPFYAAPEIEKHNSGYDPYKSDVWALGITLFLLLERRRPFNMDFQRDIKKIWNTLSSESLMFFDKSSQYKEYHNMIRHMLKKNPNKRWGMDKVKEENERINKKYIRIHVETQVENVENIENVENE